MIDNDADLQGLIELEKTNAHFAVAGKAAYLHVIRHKRGKQAGEYDTEHTCQRPNSIGKRTRLITRNLTNHTTFENIAVKIISLLWMRPDAFLYTAHEMLIL